MFAPAEAKRPVQALDLQLKPSKILSLHFTRRFNALRLEGDFRSKQETSSPDIIVV